MSRPVGVRLSATRTRDTNDHGQPLGRPVQWTAAQRPTGVVLEGKGVRLEPISLDHVDDLLAAVCGEDDEQLWTYLFWDRPRDRDLHLPEVRHVGLKSEGIPAERDRRLLDDVRFQVDQDHRGALFPGEPGGLETDAPGAAGDQNDLASQLQRFHR